MRVDSVEELMLLQWFEELESENIIISIQRGPSFNLFGGLTKPYIKETQLKTKIKVETKEKRILYPHIYTSDFKIVWNIKSKFYPKFEFLHDGSEETIIECKGKFNQHNSIRMFSINQKWVYSEYEVLVKLIVPPDLFKVTFYPSKVLEKKRKLTGDEVSLKQFLNE